MSLLVACLRAVRMRAFAVLAVPLAMLVIGSPAYADPATEADAASTAFQAGTHVYVAPGAGQQIDASAVAKAIGSDPVYVAVVPPNTPPPDVLTQLQSGLTLQGTFVVVSGTEQSAFTNVICSDKAQPLLDDAAKAEDKTRAAGDLTAFLTTYVDKVADAPKPGDAGCAEAASGSGFGAALPWILGALLLGGGGGYLWLRSRRRQKATHLAGRRRKVTDALDALARDIDEVGGRGGPHVQRALVDARERHIAAADILAEADHDADFDAATRAVREGTFAAHYARERAGLRSESPRQVEPARGERLSAERVVTVGEERATAYPSYRPGAPYYFGGNATVPAGWYTSPVGEDQFLGSLAEQE